MVSRTKVSIYFVFVVNDSIYKIKKTISDIPQSPHFSLNYLMEHLFRQNKMGMRK